MPIGRQADMEVFEELVTFGKKHGIVIAHYNPYSFILNKEPKSFLQVEGVKEITVEMNSLYGPVLCSYGSVESNILIMILKVKSNIDSGQFKPVRLAAAEALGLEDEWYDNYMKCIENAGE